MSASSCLQDVYDNVCVHFKIFWKLLFLLVVSDALMFEDNSFRNRLKRLVTSFCMSATNIPEMCFLLMNSTGNVSLQ